ncbi:LuxR C-terminal-related transcriptional regulator [Emcibacter nanhaiensis]|uniref:Response regulator transcription factor n=1 Tax=Emcibacter nanhaiensis TaxID=1505037 RepID=A0A501PG11_9PROT|nr:response regulator transcription factor [Emcibacter nanhaiensis]TPD59115.1 response regulator transcription factor [Emcibacter nanhaiensis]
MALNRVLIADDHPLFREALSDIVSSVYEEDVDCLEVCNVAETLAATDSGENFDMILLDLLLPGAEGFSCLISLRNKLPSTPIVIVSSTDHDETVRESFSYGAMGYLPKSSSREVMRNALRLVRSGNSYIPSQALGGGGERSPEQMPVTGGGAAAIDAEKASLTPRQMAVLELLAEGKPNKVIAYELDISEITVKAHVSAILRKLQVNNRLQAVIAAKNLIAQS